MFPSDFDNAYAYEIERRKDEMRDAAKSQMEHGFRKKRKPVALSMAILSILIVVSSVLFGF
jgi:hypothetical protein